MHSQVMFRGILNATRVICSRKSVSGLKLYPPIGVLAPKLFHDTKFRFASTWDSNGKTTVLQKEDSVFMKVLRKLPFVDFDKSKAQGISYLIYETIVDKLDYIDFFEKYELPDTFYSWFVITELHIWMWSVRGMAEGDAGRHIRNYLVEALWADASQRSKKLGPSNPHATRMQLSTLSEQLQAALIAYDEGLQKDDLVLSGAVWRRFYQQSDVSPIHLDSLVKYIRKQLRTLDSTPSEFLFSKEVVSWEPVKFS